jgi:hypothetical protein
MAKIEISVARKGIDVQCRMIKDDSDSELVRNSGLFYCRWGFYHSILTKMLKVKDLSTVR